MYIFYKEILKIFISYCLNPVYYLKYHILTNKYKVVWTTSVTVNKYDYSPVTKFEFGKKKIKFSVHIGNYQ